VVVVMVQVTQLLSDPGELATLRKKLRKAYDKRFGVTKFSLQKDKVCVCVCVQLSDM